MLEIVLRLVGAFYVFAGVLGMRAMVMDHLLDQMLAGITLKPIPQKEHRRRWLLTASTLAIGMGGMALMVLSLWAAPLFLFGAVGQAVYLVWARTAFLPENELERTGRRQTINAALLYGLVTVSVCAAALSGLLRDWLDPWALLIPTSGLGLLLPIGRHFLWRPRQLSRWTEPKVAVDIQPRSGPVVITIEYLIRQEDQIEFLAVMSERRRIRRRDGARHWTLLRDLHRVSSAITRSGSLP